MRDLADHHRFASESSPHAFCLVSGTHLIATGKDDQKFFPPLTSDGIVRTHRGRHAPGELAQHGVAREMAVRVVDRFEAIQVR